MALWFYYSGLPVFIPLVKPNQGYANGTVYGNWRENGEYGSAERIGMT